MKCHSIKQKYSQLTNVELDNLIMHFKKRRLESGIHYIIGFLQWHGICVQHSHVVQSLHHINRLGQVLHNQQIKHRHQYHVKCPNALWHLNGHHKLIQWGIVIYGVIDGFCRTVCTFLCMLSWLSGPNLNYFVLGDHFTCK